MPLFVGAPQEAETLINTSLQKLIKGKVFAFYFPSLNVGGDRAAGYGTVNVFTVCLSLRGLLLAAGGRPNVLSRSTSSFSSHGSLLVVRALVAFKYSTPARKMQQMLGREKARLLFTEEGAGGRNEKKTTPGAAGQKPFLLSVTRLGPY